MKRLTPLASLLAGTGMMLMISASQAGTASEAIAQAEADLAAAQSEAQNCRSRLFPSFCFSKEESELV